MSSTNPPTNPTMPIDPKDYKTKEEYIAARKAEAERAVAASKAEAERVTEAAAAAWEATNWESGVKALLEGAKLISSPEKISERLKVIMKELGLELDAKVKSERRVLKPEEEDKIKALYVEGKNANQIANALNIPYATARNRVKKLKEANKVS